MDSILWCFLFPRGDTSIALSTCQWQCWESETSGIIPITHHLCNVLACLGQEIFALVSSEAFPGESLKCSHCANCLDKLNFWLKGELHIYYTIKQLNIDACICKFVFPPCVFDNYVDLNIQCIHLLVICIISMLYFIEDNNWNLRNYSIF